MFVEIVEQCDFGCHGGFNMAKNRLGHTDNRRPRITTAGNYLASPELTDQLGYFSQGTGYRLNDIQCSI